MKKIDKIKILIGALVFLLVVVLIGVGVWIGKKSIQNRQVLNTIQPSATPSASDFLHSSDEVSRDCQPVQTGSNWEMLIQNECKDDRAIGFGKKIDGIYYFFDNSNQKDLYLFSKQNGKIEKVWNERLPFANADIIKLARWGVGTSYSFDFLYDKPKDILYMLTCPDLQSGECETFSGASPLHGIYKIENKDGKLSGGQIEKIYAGIYGTIKILDYYPDQELLIFGSDGGDGCCGFATITIINSKNSTKFTKTAMSTGEETINDPHASVDYSEEFLGYDGKLLYFKKENFKDYLKFYFLDPLTLVSSEVKSVPENLIR